MHFEDSTVNSSRKRKLETPPLTDFQVVVAIPRPQLGDGIRDERKNDIDQTDPLQKIPGLNTVEQYLIGFGKFWVFKNKTKGITELFRYGRIIPAFHRFLINVVNKKCLVDYEAFITNSSDKNPDEHVLPEQQENYDKALNLVVAAFNYHSPKKKYALADIKARESAPQATEEPRSKKPKTTPTETKSDKGPPKELIDTMARIKKVMEQPFPAFPKTDKDLGWPTGERINETDPDYKKFFYSPKYGVKNRLDILNKLKNQYYQGRSADLSTKSKNKTTPEEKIEKIRKHIVATFEEKRTELINTSLIEKFQNIHYLVEYPDSRHMIQTVKDHLKSKSGNQFIDDKHIPAGFLQELIRIFDPGKKRFHSREKSIHFKLSETLASLNKNPLFQDAKRFMVDLYNAKLAFKLHPIKDDNPEQQSTAVAMDTSSSNSSDSRLPVPPQQSNAMDQAVSSGSQNGDVSQNAVEMDTASSNSSPVQPDGSSIPPYLYAESPSFLMFSPPVPSAGLTIPGVDDEEDLWRPQGDSNPCYRRERAMS
jgi:hypothetical protein